MPSVSSPANVLVTGASGYFATTLIRTLLDNGYTVRGAVRNRSKGEYLERQFGIETVIVEDMAAVSPCFDMGTMMAELEYGV